MSSIEMCRPALDRDSGTSHEGDFDLVAVSQVDIVLVSLVKSQEGEPNVEESVAMEGSELIDDLFPPRWLLTLTQALVMPLLQEGGMVLLPFARMLLPADKMLLPLGKMLLSVGRGNELTTG